MTSPLPCIFCGSMEGLTKEDVISTWLNKALPAELPGSRFGHRKVSYDQGNTEIHRLIPRQTRSFLEIRNVCAACNNGWMSSLDKAAKAVVQPMLYGNALSLDNSQMQAVAKWLVLKFMVKDSDPDRKPPPVVSQKQRTEFLQYGIIPQQFEVFLGRYEGRMIVGHTGWGSASPSFHMFIFGRLLSIVTYCDEADYFASNPSPMDAFTIDLGNPFLTFGSPASWDEYRCQIWPIENDPVAWPPRTTFDSDVIDVTVPPASMFTPTYERQQHLWHERLRNAGFASQMFHLVECRSCEWHIGQEILQPNVLVQKR